MKIAILASNRYPLPSPPDTIFAPGVIIQELVEGLVAKGHKVVLFAPEGTKTKAKLITAKTKALYEEFSSGGDFAAKKAAKIGEYLNWDTQSELLLAATAFEYIRKDDFDVVHAHKTRHEIYFSSFVDVPCVFTFHDAPKKEVANKFDELRLKKYAESCYFVSISNAQRKGLEYLNWAGTVYNGIKIADFQFSQGGEVFLFSGRLTEEKGVDLAVEVARKAGVALEIVGDINYTPAGLRLYEKIRPFIDNQKIKYRGHVPFGRMSGIYQQAKALLFPITSPEAFGLVMIEAMACGTPVVAFGLGSVPEIVKDGRTGFVVKPGNLQGMIEAVRKISEMPAEEYQQMRQNCRRHVEQNFSIEKMVTDYEKVYQKVIADWQKRKRNR